MAVGNRACRAHGRTGACGVKDTEPIKSAGERRDDERGKKIVTQEAVSVCFGFTCSKFAALKHLITKAF